MSRTTSTPRSRAGLRSPGFAALLCLGAVAIGQDRQFQPFVPRGREIVDALNSAFLRPHGGGPAVLYSLPQRGMTLPIPSGTANSYGIFSAGVRRAVFADIDGDGVLDLMLSAVADSAARATIGFRTSSTSTNFTYRALPADTELVRGAALGDVDGDGDLDLVRSTVALQGGEGIQVLVGQNGTFAVAPSRLPAGTPAGCWLTLVDDDGDGDPDLLATSPTAPPVRYGNDGTGHFAIAGGAHSAFAGPHAQHLADDLDGDGFVDLALLTTAGNVELLWGSANGPVAAGAPPLAGAVGLESCDLDGDGRRELVGWHHAGFAVLRHAAARQFIAAERVDEPVAISAVAIADRDGDGLDEILTHLDAGLRRTWSGATILQSDPAAVAGVLPTRSGFAPGPSLFGDCDGDGRTDVVIPRSAGVDVFVASGQGHFARRELAATVPVQVSRAQLADLDGDGDLDLVLDDGGHLTVLANDGAARFQPWFTVLRTHPSTANEIRYGDIDGDGATELVRSLAGGLQVVRGGSGSSRISYVPVALLATSVRSIDLVDLDGDGDLDLATGAPLPGGGTLVLANDGGGGFVAPLGAGLPVGGTVLWLAHGDVDGDGDQDVVAGTSSGLALLRNDGAGAFVDVSAAMLPALPAQNGPITVADLDQDGRPDLLSSPGTLLRNDGNRFVDVTAVRIDPQTVLHETTAVDVDDDGDLDLLSRAPSSHPVVLTNHLRQLVVPDPISLGAVIPVDLYSGPTFGPSGLGVVLVALAGSQVPPRIPGIAGILDLDPNLAAVLPPSQLSSVGRSRRFLAIPNQPALLGTGLVLQGAVLSTGPQPIGFTNALRDAVVR